VAEELTIVPGTTLRIVSHEETVLERYAHVYRIVDA
jgi:hypothetical protein